MARRIALHGPAGGDLVAATRSTRITAGSRIHHERLDLDALRDRLAGRPALEQPGGSPTAVREEPSAAATAGDGSGIAADRADESSADADLESTLAAIEARLEQLESALAGQEYRAQVVDAGDGTILLRLKDPPAQLEHGQTVNIRLPADDALSEREP